MYIFPPVSGWWFPIELPPLTGMGIICKHIILYIDRTTTTYSGVTSHIEHLLNSGKV